MLELESESRMRSNDLSFQWAVGLHRKRYLRKAYTPCTAACPMFVRGCETGVEEAPNLYNALMGSETEEDDSAFPHIRLAY